MKFVYYSILFPAIIAVYFLSSGGNTPYNYFILLADAFLQGRYWLVDNPSWLSELIPIAPNKFYVVYPPLPAILAMPFVVVFGTSFPQQYLAHLLGALSALTTGFIAWHLTKNPKKTIFMIILCSLGTIMWYLSSVGSSWYLGQITAVLFISCAIFESLTKKRIFVVGLLIGCAFLSRLQTILALPFFIYYLRSELTNPLKVVNFVFPIALFTFANFFYNYVRYGVPWDMGYFLIPGTLNEPWFSKGIFHPSYIIEDLKIAFWSFPKYIDKFPYLIPSWAGLSIWITTPAFIYTLKSNIKERQTILAWLAILAIWLINGMHGGTGFAQFGYRFAVDFYPFLFFLTANGLKEKELRWHHFLLLAISVIVNLWGVIWINKFGWVEY